MVGTVAPMITLSTFREGTLLYSLIHAYLYSWILAQCWGKRKEFMHDTFQWDRVHQTLSLFKLGWEWAKELSKTKESVVFKPEWYGPWYMFKQHISIAVQMVIWVTTVITRTRDSQTVLCAALTNPFLSGTCTPLDNPAMIIP